MARCPPNRWHILRRGCGEPAIVAVSEAPSGRLRPERTRDLTNSEKRRDNPMFMLGSSEPRQQLPKTPTGILGLDEITCGGLPKGRPTLVCGPAGCGKTLLGLEFLARGIVEFNEPGVFVAFEEAVSDLVANATSLGFDLARYEADGHLILDHINTEAGTVATGEWDLDGLMIRLGAAIDEVGAKRIVIDTLETLFGTFPDTATLRSELHRLFDWLKERGVTALITSERGDGTLTRGGVNEYVSDCVIVLDNRVTAQTSTRRMRILKYRGSLHGTNEYPFLIGESGISVLPITSEALQHPVSSLRISTGIARLDAMLGGGVYRGSTVLISGTAGTGKSTLAAQFSDATCQRGERALYFSFEESEAELIRNMKSAGIDLQKWVDAGLLQFYCFRPGLLGLESHLVMMQKAAAEFKPAVVVKDSVSDLLRSGVEWEVTAMLTRQIDYLKSIGITTLFTNLTHRDDSSEVDDQMASLTDTWLELKTMEGNGEHNRVIYIRKSRGMAHSNQIREFLLTDHGIELADVYLGPAGVLTGSARQAQEARERSDGTARLDDLAQRKANLLRRREAVQVQTATLWREFEDEAEIVEGLLNYAFSGVADSADQRAAQGRLRQADTEKPITDDPLPILRAW